MLKIKNCLHVHKCHGKLKYVVSITMQRLLKIKISQILMKSPSSNSHFSGEFKYITRFDMQPQLKPRNLLDEHETILIGFVFL